MGLLWQKYLWSHCCFMALPVCFTNHSPTNKSSVRESGKVKTGAAEKASTAVTAAKTDTKGRGTQDHHGEMFKVYLIQMSVDVLWQVLIICSVLSLI